MDVQFQFMKNPRTGESKQEDFFFLTNRNQCFSGGYGNGKTYIGCLKAYTLLSTFPKYRMAILRASSVDLRRTTMETFFKVCPPSAYSKGGRVDSRNELTLDNGSEVFWMHLDQYDENLVRGLEINSYLIDQAEEVDESIYLHLDSRLDRWDVAEVPEHLDPERFPKNDATGKPKPPAYGMILCNPDAKSHWIYQRYHPDSAEHNRLRDRIDRYTGEKTYYRYSDSHKMIQATSFDNPALSQETLDSMMTRSEGFVKRFVYGEWGLPGGAVHEIQGKSKIFDMPRELYNEIVNKGELFIALDHGDASPTCALWFSKYKGCIFVFQEYYKAGAPISEHRVNIAFLNTNDKGIYFNTTNVCDPSMLNKTQQKKGGWATLADEYSTSEYNAPPIHFQPADNNEFITRSRINEGLRNHPEIKHPITGEPSAPMIYFIMKGVNYPYGCHHVTDQTESQKYEKLGTINGEDIYGDDRDKNVTDHAYDPLRYGMARILMYFHEEVKKPANYEQSFMGLRDKAIKQQRKFKRLAGVHSNSYGRPL